MKGKKTTGQRVPKAHTRAVKKAAKMPKTKPLPSRGGSRKRG